MSLRDRRLALLPAVALTALTAAACGGGGTGGTTTGADGSITVKPANDSKRARAFWGMHRTLVQNLVTGVTEGFTKTLEITGVGYRAAAQGKNLRLQLGYSHDVNLDIPEGLTVATPDQTTVIVTGNDRQKVGQFAAEIRRWRKPEPYKGKGIKYRGEFIFRKEGKKK